ncbi:MFS transporter [Kribbella jejuensis]|uniref:Putative MFS family arabinose efflux permease n=1 Tax=Kribbella jejuensis TaxID=236068 RepID=A0A542E7T2_9ACTN|nr:MFS transporter [Kribbella jejuensis]TQJ11387.1 putative MFS family arabinose efflux permease [Kribbella jejuensis]
MTALTGNTSTRPGRWAVVCVAQFVVVLDATIVTTALPRIGADLHFAAGTLPWVFTAYTIVLAGLLVLGGRTADVAGSRRVFRWGLGLFSAASLACALAWSPASLVVARLFQGAGAALLSPAALAALSDALPPDAARRALGWWTAAGAAGGASGWFVGGLITQVAGWRWVFAVNVPLGIVALLWSLRSLPSHGTTTRIATLDLPGACTATAGIGMTALGLSKVAGDPSAWTGWAALAIAVLLLLTFLRIERSSRQPLVPLGFARTPGVLGGNLTAAAVTGATSPAMVTVALYVQDTLRLPPALAGLIFPLFNLAVIGGSLLGPRVIHVLGVRRTLVIGFLGIAVGVLLLIPLPPQGLPLALLSSGFGVMGVGLGLASVASTTAGTAYVRQADRGLAAGVLNSSAQLGTSLGLALAGPVVAAGGPMTGYRTAYLLGVAVAVAGAVAGLTAPRSIRTGGELG